MIELTKDTKACFIERSETVNPMQKLVIEGWLKKMTVDTERLSYSNYITLEVVSAWDNADKVWAAIQQCDHVWAHTFFNGRGAALFCQMLELVVSNGTRDKLFFDIADRAEALDNLYLYAKDAVVLMQQLERRNNIQFLFWDSIEKMLKA